MNAAACTRWNTLALLTTHTIIITDMRSPKLWRTLSSKTIGTDELCKIAHHSNLAGALSIETLHIGMSGLQRSTTKLSNGLALVTPCLLLTV